MSSMPGGALDTHEEKFLDSDMDHPLNLSDCFFAASSPLPKFHKNSSTTSCVILLTKTYTEKITFTNTSLLVHRRNKNSQKASFKGTRAANLDDGMVLPTNRKSAFSDSRWTLLRIIQTSCEMEMSLGMRNFLLSRLFTCAPGNFSMITFQQPH